MAPITLLSLNQDVLSEILSFLLLDTPRELNRTSILRTCSSLHLLGLPHLYRIVDLSGYQTVREVGSIWSTLFGKGGVLTVEGRNQEVGRCVRELRLGSKNGAALVAHRPADYRSIPNAPNLNLPSCTSLLFDLASPRPEHLDLHSTIIPQLPILHLTLDYHRHPSAYGRRSITDTFRDPLDQIVSSLSSRTWDLQSLTFRNTIWWDGPWKPDARRIKKLLLSKWVLQVLVIRLDEVDSYGDRDLQEEVIVSLFLDVESGDQLAFLPRTERIEFRGGPKLVEKEFREVIAKRGKVGLSEFERRIASLIVFVDEDGTERRLTDGEET